MGRHFGAGLHWTWEFPALAGDGVFWTALTNNSIWTCIFLTVPMAMGLLAASMLLIARRGRTFFQVIYFLPVVIATAITARIWQGMIYSPATGVFISGFTLNNNSFAATATLNLKVLQAVQRTDNQPYAAYQKWLVLINNHDFATGTAGY